MNKMMLKKQYMMYSPKKSGGRLPSDFQEVEYIQGTGTQYINTLVIPTSKTGWKIEFEQTEKISVWYFGVDTGWVTNGFGFNVHKAQNETNIYPLLYINSSTVSNFDKIEANQKYVVKYGNGLLSVNSKEYSVPSFTGTQSNPIYTNSINRNGTPDSIEQGTGKIYSLKFYEDNTIIRDFIPCYRKSDNEVGLYDIVGKQFYTNQGSGTFIKGANI